MSLQGHTALITGATQGVGAAIARSLARAGARLVLHGLRLDDQAEAVADQCRAEGVPVDLLAGDLVEATDDACRGLCQQATALAPEIDILVNNAGTFIDQPFLDMDFGTFDRTMKLNVYSHFFLTQQFARYWVHRKMSACVLMTGSINGRLAEQVHTAYDTSKGAVEMMVKSLCVSLAPHGIRVNGMAPGLVYTPLTAPALDDPRFRRWMELHTPSGQVPGADVCGEVAAFLVSDAARHIHGQMLLVDGGMSAWQQPDPPADLHFHG